MIKSQNLLSKEIVKTLVYTTASQDRLVYTPVSINGRTYLKTGELQVVSFVGNVYKVYNNETNMYEYWLHVGMSKQHPCDSKIDKKEGFEKAQENAFMNPFMIMQVNKRFGDITWRKIISAYVADMDLEFVMTKQEILNSGKKIEDYNR